MPQAPQAWHSAAGMSVGGSALTFSSRQHRLHPPPPPSAPSAPPASSGGGLVAVAFIAICLLVLGFAVANYRGWLISWLLRLSATHQHSRVATAERPDDFEAVYERFGSLAPAIEAIIGEAKAGSPWEAIDRLTGVSTE